VKKKYTASIKDKKDWEDFIGQIEDIRPKEEDEIYNNVKFDEIKKLDLHGFSLNEANQKVEEFLIDSFNQGCRKILIITGKGSRSKINENPYISREFGVLKNSIPEFIKNDKNLNEKIIKIVTADNKHGGNGAIYVFLKKNKIIK
jgi:DNA-nicking Smr family endonuclease